jgi:hypothetical protein
VIDEVVDVPVKTAGRAGDHGRSDESVHVAGATLLGDRGVRRQTRPS